MTELSPIIPSLNAGELSPLLEGRVDFDKYAKGLRTCENFIPTIQGPLKRRPGTRFVAEVKDSADTTALIPFQFSTSQSYMIEAGDQYFRFYKNQGALLESAETISGATQANPVVVTVTGHPYSNGDTVVIESVVGMTELNGRRFIVANAATNTFELTDTDGNNVDGTGYTAYSSGGTAEKIHEISTPYGPSDVAQIKWAQSADVMYLFHPDYAVRKLTRDSSEAFSLAEVDFIDGPFLPENQTTTTLTASGTSGSVTITASATTGINDGDGFKSTDVGRLIRLIDNADFHYLTITAFTDSTHVTATIENGPLNATGARQRWHLGVWSDTTGYPAAGTFHDDRLVAGGCASFPQRVDGSAVGDYEHFLPTDPNGTIADDNAFAFTLSANEVNQILWMETDEKGLLIGTFGGEWIMAPSSANEVITASNVRARQTSKRGSENLSPVRVDDSLLFVQRIGRKLREMAFVFERDKFATPDMAVAAEHITKGGIIDIAYQQQPQSIVWMARADGTLLGFTYERDQEVLAWHRHSVGGTDAKVQAVGVIAGDDDDDVDELWVVVERTINSVTRKYVEYLTRIWDHDDAIEDAVCVDASAVYSGSPATTISGLDHLEGETVAVLADGVQVADKTVASGAITLSSSASKVQVGLAYVSDAETERIDYAIQGRTGQAKDKRVSRAFFRLQDAYGGQFGPDFDTLDDIEYDSVALFSGDKEVNWNGGNETDARLCIRSATAYPMTLLAIIPVLDGQV